RAASSRALSISATRENSPPELIPNRFVIPRAFGEVPGLTWRSQDAPASAEVPDPAAIVRRKSRRPREDELVLLHREESRAKNLKGDYPIPQQVRSASSRPAPDSVNLSLSILSRAPGNSSRLRINTKGMLRAKAASISFSVDSSVE